MQQTKQGKTKTGRPRYHIGLDGKEEKGVARKEPVVVLH
jgi:hypothetical protein